MGTYRDSLIAAMVVFLLINTLAISARLYVRLRLLTRAIGLDDLMLCLVFVSPPETWPLFTHPRGYLPGWVDGLLIHLQSSEIESTERIRDSLRLGVRIYVLGIRGS